MDGLVFFLYQDIMGPEFCQFLLPHPYEILTKAGPMATIQIRENSPILYKKEHCFLKKNHTLDLVANREVCTH